LQVLDGAWREHLYQMDILKTGIGLRGYNQKDPLTEYKKESYNLFMELVNRLKNESIKTLQIVRFKTEDDENTDRALEKMQDEANLQNKFEKKPARNEPCPCGSGKKYKDCCGKSGPKKGVFA
ncbi:SEC-C metal-binding domain-containing protein, partial [Campylobacter fetus]